MLPACAGRTGPSSSRGWDELRFAHDLWKADLGPGNRVVSPACVSAALTMLAAGAKGTTKQEIVEALRASSAGAIAATIEARASDWTGAGEPQVTMANSLWSQAKLEVSASYANTIAARFDALARELPGDGSAAQEAVNAWVSAQTKGQIDTLLEGPPDPATAAMLISTLHFVGAWVHAFDPADTTLLPFRRDDGVEVEVPMMRGALPLRLAWDEDGFALAELPYVGELGLDMLVIRPPKDTTLASASADLDVARLRALIDMLDANDPGADPPQPIVIGLPRFKVSARSDLVEVMRTLGMRQAFDPDQAQLGGISRAPLWVSQFTHAVVVEVDEAGTEASAAASLALSSRSRPTRFWMDRPFWYVIRQRGGPWLFVGQMADPSAA